MRFSTRPAHRVPSVCPSLLWNVFIGSKPENHVDGHGNSVRNICERNVNENCAFDMRVEMVNHLSAELTFIKWLKFSAFEHFEGWEWAHAVAFQWARMLRVWEPNKNICTACQTTKSNGITTFVWSSTAKRHRTRLHLQHTFWIVFGLLRLLQQPTAKQ